MVTYLQSQQPFGHADYSPADTAGGVRMRSFPSCFSGIEHMISDQGGAQQQLS